MQSRRGIQRGGGLRRIDGHKTLAELATQFGAPPTQIKEWKPHMLARPVDVFGGTKSTSDALDLTVLHATIEQLALEHDC